MVHTYNKFYIPHNMSLKKHYASLFHKFGPGHEAVQYSSLESQYKRFEVLSEPLCLSDSVIDLGCGLGGFLTYLRQEKGFTGKYLGLDFVDEFINHAGKEHQHDSQSSFAHFNILNDEIPQGYDAIFVSGVFNNAMEDNWSFIIDTIKKMHTAANHLVSFNALSTYVDYEDEGLYYTDPLALFDHCKNEISPFVTLRHDYLVKNNSIPFEFTLYLYK